MEQNPYESPLLEAEPIASSDSDWWKVIPFVVISATVATAAVQMMHSLIAMASGEQ